MFRILLFTLATFSLQAQQKFQGKATYITHSKSSIELEDGEFEKANIPSELKEQLMEVIKNGSKQTYELKFDKTQSVYKEVEKLSKPKANSSNVSVSISFSGSGTIGGDILYKNIKENRYTTSSEFFGKLFLIQDELKTHNWKLEKETKTIGEYTVYKATKTITLNRSSITSFSVNEDKSSKKEEQDTEEKIITAWYTPQIPVNAGPGHYHGLPGLILELNDGVSTTICSKIVLNPSDDIDIKEPKKGKKVSQEKYDAIIEKKSKEQIENFRQRGTESSFQIIGG